MLCKNTIQCIAVLLFNVLRKYNSVDCANTAVQKQSECSWRSCCEANMPRRVIEYSDHLPCVCIVLYVPVLYSYHLPPQSSVTSQHRPLQRQAFETNIISYKKIHRSEGPFQNTKYKILNTKIGNMIIQKYTNTKDTKIQKYKNTKRYKTTEIQKYENTK